MLEFLPNKESLIFMGSVGTGKTHLATAIALKACQEGRKVRFYTAASLGNVLLEKNNKGTLNNYLGTLKKVELIDKFIMHIKKSIVDYVVYTFSLL